MITNNNNLKDNPDLYHGINTVKDLVQQAAIAWPNNTAITSLGGKINYKQLDQDSSIIANWLKSNGYKYGDRIGVALPNILANPVAIIGIIKAGMTAVCLNPLYTSDELHHAIKDSGMKCLFVFSAFVGVAKKAITNTSVHQVITVLPGEYLGLKSPLINMVAQHRFGKQPSIIRSIKWSKVLRSKVKKPNFTELPTPDETAIIIYSGGTSGTPKGVPMTHKGLLTGLSQQNDIVENFRKSENRYSVMLAVPMYHILGLGSFFYSLSQGGTSIMVMNPSDRASMIKEWKRTPVVSFPAVNSLFNSLLEDKNFHALDFSNLAFCLGAGMAVSSTTARRWHLATGCEISEGYGLTETGLIAVNPFNKNKIGSVGIPVNGVDIKLIDSNHKTVEKGSKGEICVQGGAVLKNYLSNNDQEIHTSDGYFRTGDIGQFDDDGYLFIVDRLKDVIISSGFNVFPADVERVINSISGVYESAVIAKKDESSGEVPVAYVVKRDDISEADIFKICKEQLTGYKRPREIIFIDEIPKSSVGKILRRQLS